MADAGGIGGAESRGGGACAVGSTDRASVVACGRELPFALRSNDVDMWASNVRAYPIVCASRLRANAKVWRLTAVVPDAHGVECHVSVIATGPTPSSAEQPLCDELYRRELGAWAVKLGIDHLREAA